MKLKTAMYAAVGFAALKLGRYYAGHRIRRDLRLGQGRSRS
jgi:hypothetical protein